MCDLDKELTLGLGLWFSGFPCQCILTWKFSKKHMKYMRLEIIKIKIVVSQRSIYW